MTLLLLWHSCRARGKEVLSSQPGEDIDNWSFSSLQDVVDEYKEKSNDTGNTKKAKASHQDDQ